MRTLGELRAALAEVPDDAEFIVCADAKLATDPDTGELDGHVLLDPGAVRSVDVRRPGDGSWPFAEDDPDAPPAVAYLLVGEFA